MLYKERQSWRRRILSADKIWAQVNQALQSRNLDLQATPRRPDVRLIVNNISGVDKIFHNPGDHSNSLAEHVPSSGDSTAAMVMVEGETLAEQYLNAQKLYDEFHLDTEGLSDEFLQAIQKDCAEGLVREAYGPAPFEGQSQKLTNVDWQNLDGSKTAIRPVFGKAAAYGARDIESEKVFAVDVEIYVKGTDSVPEEIESAVMFVAVSEDWKTGEQKTRPIVPSVAMEFYGHHYEDIPSVTVSPSGRVKDIDLKNGTVIDLTGGTGEAPALKRG